MIGAMGFHQALFPGIVHRTAEGDTENYLIIGPGPPDTARCRHLFQQKPADLRRIQARRQGGYLSQERENLTALRPVPAPIADAYITHKLRANSTGKLKTKKTQ
ncbi:hypothetical protein GE21DRAFT_4212 [Neurospora crassa]|uniref:Uncharacterized protein n=1 Tax=Neurospora crassa (strain ATCC 24698 / 74-OR23-1A / CBS 708.71 / DSM 1257 / FGSC 987) TaxID=367110 RepID=Q7SBS6_NEUCR|nr:hypothetical protein NCU06229 [Neurospora crassa OR74A]EAA33844.1 hypothetical protein NCU06229 [Neurospora crassa OR74A]KHE87064.1 hypothetical protein GE21DRAFT_4212 [Neurospora crassa]|eukprot:XP_963080.1 hypothetical protein NCU06229 [Neurospora crassa OR74A]